MDQGLRLLILTNSLHQICYLLTIVIVDPEPSKRVDFINLHYILGGLSITQSAIDFVVAVSDGDCRTALNSLQTAVDGFRDVADYVITKEDIKSSLKKTHFLYDRKGQLRHLLTYYN